MDSVEASFFHTAFGVVLFVVAIGCFMLNVNSVNSFLKIRQNDMEDKAMYETDSVEKDRIVMGNTVLLYVLDERETDTKISLRDGSDWMIQSGSSEGIGLDKLHARIAASFWIEYEYDETGRIKTVCFIER